MKSKRACAGVIGCRGFFVCFLLFFKSRLGFFKKVTFQGNEEKLALQMSVKRVFQEEGRVSAKTPRQEHFWFALRTEQQGCQGCRPGAEREESSRR